MLTLTLNPENPQHLQILEAIVGIYKQPPANLDISSGRVTDLPNTVTVYTSTEQNAELAKQTMTLAPGAEVVADVEDETDAKRVAAGNVVADAANRIVATEAVKMIEDAKQAADLMPDPPKPEPPAKPDARALVEAVVNVKTEKVKVDNATIEEAVEELDKETLGHIRGLQVKLAQLGGIDDMKRVIREVTGIEKGKVAELPAKYGPALLEQLGALAHTLEEKGKS